MKKLNRRKFVRASSLVVPGLMLAPMACTSGKTNNENQEDTTSITDLEVINEPILKEFGLQLYTLRNDMPKDPKGVLEKIASYGYSYLEGYEGEMGLWWGMSHTEFKEYLDGLGLKFVASHFNPTENFEQKIAEAAEVGTKYMLSPWVGPQESLDAFRKIADQFNVWGEKCKEAGIRFGYHNHAYSFQEQEGALPQDILMENTDPELVYYEMDMYWVVTAGHDPMEWINKYPGRFKLCHLKDRLKEAVPDEREASCVLGTGSIDYGSIIPASKEAGMEYFIVEQERYDLAPLEAVEANAGYLKGVKG